MVRIEGVSAFWTKLRVEIIKTGEVEGVEATCYTSSHVIVLIVTFQADATKIISCKLLASWKFLKILEIIFFLFFYEAFNLNNAFFGNLSSLT